MEISLNYLQQKVYDYIASYIKTYGHAPTTAEVAKGLGLSSAGSMHRHIKNLEKLGVIAIEKGKRRNIHIKQASSNAWELPVLGKIAAGKPIEAINSHDTLDMAHLFNRRNLFVLEVKGDSMRDIGILDGDKVICEQRTIAMNGEIVVALIDGHEATLKRFHNNQDGTVTLIPENNTMFPMTYLAGRISIQGIWVGLVRVHEHKRK